MAGAVAIATRAAAMPAVFLVRGVRHARVGERCIFVGAKLEPAHAAEILLALLIALTSFATGLRRHVCVLMFLAVPALCDAAPVSASNRRSIRNVGKYCELIQEAAEHRVIE